MVFSTTLFLFIYLPVVLLLYYITPLKGRNVVLLLANLVFYGWGEPVYIAVMAASVLFDYIFGIQVERNRENKSAAKAFVALSVVMNLGLLVFFKYTDFIITNIGMNALGVALPLGISFYTFQKMSYIIDVYRGDAKAQPNIISFATFVTLFPQLIAGPIIKYRDIASQIDSREHNADRFSAGICTFMVGLGKKVLLANNIGMLWDIYKAGDLSHMSVLGAWLGAAAFTFQIYFDFSGYSDMAIGLGRMFGFEFKINFNYPYISQSVTEFWRRWHISLGSWFREYLYIPLGGNRVAVPRFVINLLIVWAATGIWHGASWNFLIWGLYYGAVLVLEKLFLLKALDKLPAAVRVVYSMFVVMIGWVIFSIEDLASFTAYIGAMFGASGALASPADVYYLLSYLPLIVIMAIASTPLVKDLYLRMGETAKRAFSLAAVVLGIIVCTAYLVDSTYNPFLYFRF
ncbi:MAG: MBOAT family protein [Clostridia bacterium]|nr:MBOAT family protein [Clostridia bacterium]